jgi:DNA-binding response OmpR family regulator
LNAATLYLFIASDPGWRNPTTGIAAGRRQPIIFITAYPEESTRARALEAGAICFLSKPFDGSTLSKYLSAAVEDAGGAS